MKKAVMMMLLGVWFSTCVFAEEAEKEQEKTSAGKETLNPWVGNYCVSFFRRARSSKIAPKGTGILSLKVEYFDADEKWNKTTQGTHHGLPSGDEWQTTSAVLTTKYGWAQDHQIAVGVPFLFNNLDSGAVDNQSHGLGNIFFFEKWNFQKETNTLPGMAVDFWYYAPTGDPDRRLGTDDDAYKVTAEVSKAWKDFSLHFNPGYTWNKAAGDNDTVQIDGAIMFTPTAEIWPAIEYNYTDTKGKGHAHDIIPGVVWKFRKGSSFKLGAIINLDTTMTYRDKVGLVFKLYQTF